MMPIEQFGLGKFAVPYTTGEQRMQAIRAVLRRYERGQLDADETLRVLLELGLIAPDDARRRQPGAQWERVTSRSDRLLFWRLVRPDGSFLFVDRHHNGAWRWALRGPGIDPETGVCRVRKQGLATTTAAAKRAAERECGSG